MTVSYPNLPSWVPRCIYANQNNHRHQEHSRATYDILRLYIGYPSDFRKALSWLWMIIMLLWQHKFPARKNATLSLLTKSQLEFWDTQPATTVWLHRKRDLEGWYLNTAPYCQWKHQEILSFHDSLGIHYLWYAVIHSGALVLIMCWIHGKVSSVKQGSWSWFKGKGPHILAQLWTEWQCIKLPAKTAKGTAQQVMACG